MENILYGNYLSQPFRNVCIFLDSINIKYKYERIIFDPDSMELLRKYNPQAKVPTFIYNNEVFYESTSIIRHFSRKFKNDLYPVDDLNTILKIEEYFQIHHRLVRKLTVLPFLETSKIKDEEIEKMCTEYNNKAFKYIENVLLNKEHEFLINNKITIADIYLANSLYNLNILNIDLSSYPKILNFLGKVKNFPNFEKWLLIIKKIISKRNYKLYGLN